MNWTEDLKNLIDRAISLETGKKSDPLNVLTRVDITRRGGQGHDNDYDVTINDKVSMNYRCITFTDPIQKYVAIKCKPINDEKGVLKLYRQQYAILHSADKRSALH